jgi:eukaryotic-like serine/threonine-protein kinase
MPLQPGDLLLNGKYIIRALLGRGGFGFVYLADDTLLHGPVALKELIPALVGDEEILRRFLAEARATMRLTHPRIVRSHDVFAERGNYYIVMEYMAGGSLEARLVERGALPVEEAVRVAAEVCDGLAHAHAEGVVHCDLKPANVLFDGRGHAKIADFGIAHVPSEMLSRSWHTQGGFTAGTLPYMSPEQADGVRDDPRVDVYAVAAVLYRMLTGRPYLDFDTRETPGAQAENVLRIRGKAPVPPGAYNRGVPGWLDAVVLKGLAKRPEGRHDSAAELRKALLRREPPRVTASPAGLLVAKTVLTAPHSAPAHSLSRPKPRALPSWFWLGVGGALALFALVVAVTAWISGRGHDRTPIAVSLTTVPGRAPLSVASTRESPEAATPAPASEPAVGVGSMTVSERDGMTLVYVPAGVFLMGSTDADPEAASDEKPQHAVTLEAFWIDRTEVTAGQYRACVTSGKCAEPKCTGSGKGDHSVVCVSWQDAAIYCAWAGRRLPTEAEWEKAARGADGRKYPWGNASPDCARANYRGQGGGCVGGTSAVGSHPAGASPYGALDMAGNVWEWVNDRYDGGYYSVSPGGDPQGPPAGASRVLRGGAWYYGGTYLRVAGRHYHVPTYQHFGIGFRCAATAGM